MEQAFGERLRPSRVVPVYAADGWSRAAPALHLQGRPPDARRRQRLPPARRAPAGHRGPAADHRPPGLRDAQRNRPCHERGGTLPRDGGSAGSSASSGFPVLPRRSAAGTRQHGRRRSRRPPRRSRGRPRTALRTGAGARGGWRGPASAGIPRRRSAERFTAAGAPRLPAGGRGGLVAGAQQRLLLCRRTPW